MPGQVKRSRIDLENGQSVPTDEAHLQSSSANNNANTQAERTQRQLPWVVNGERGSRFFCPVNDCPHANLFQAKGWASLQGVKNHLKEHFTFLDLGTKRCVRI